MLAVLNITAPLFFLIGLGYLTVRTGIFPAQFIPALGRFVLYFCIPGVILSNLLRSSPAEIFEKSFVLVYGSAAIITLLCAALISRYVLRRPMTESFLFGMGSSIPNSMFIGLPVILNVIPEQAAKVFVLCVLVENIIIMPLVLFVTEWSQAKQEASGLRIVKTILSRVTSNPIILAIAVGLLLPSLGVSSPDFLQSALELLARSAAAASLIVIGGSLVGNRVRGDIGAIGIVASGKLVLQPALVFLFAGIWLTDQPALATGLLLITASPMFSIYPIIAGNYGYGKTCASILLFTTLASFVSLNLILSFVV